MYGPDENRMIQIPAREADALRHTIRSDGFQHFLSIPDAKSDVEVEGLLRGGNRDFLAQTAYWRGPVLGRRGLHLPQIRTMVGDYGYKVVASSVSVAVQKINTIMSRFVERDEGDLLIYFHVIAPDLPRNAISHVEEAIHEMNEVSADLSRGNAIRREWYDI